MPTHFDRASRIKRRAVPLALTVLGGLAGLGLGAPAIASAAAAAADPGTGKADYTLADMADRALMVTVDGSAKLKTGVLRVGSCEVEVSGDGPTWTVSAVGDGSECAPLWRNAGLSERRLKFPAQGNGDGVTIVFALTPPRRAATLPLTYEASTRTVGPLAKGQHAFAYAPDAGWYALDVGTDGRAELRGGTVEALSGGSPTTIIHEELGSDGSLEAHGASAISENAQPARGNAPVEARAPTTTTTTSSPAPATGSVRCVDSERRDTVYICAMVDGSNISFAQLPKSVIPPNTSVEVEVIAPTTFNVEISMTGKRGAFIPSDRFSGSINVSHSGSEGVPRGGPPKSTRQVFAPRTPGDADVEISITDDTGREVASKSLELIIDRTYAGAVRLGIGLHVANTVDHEYEVRTVGASQQSEIVATKGGTAGLELVLGYAPYIFDYIQNRGRGRSYTNTRLRERAAGFAPYFGLGLVSTSGTGLEVLQSLHMGMEWEPTPHFSIAATGVGRRVTRLGHGLRVGSPLTGDIPTREIIGWGAAVVLNFSTEFFRVASRESRRNFRGGQR